MFSSKEISPPPPSSPPSSPSTLIDSSPPSSPTLDPYVPPVSVCDPFAASTRANRPPPLYERKRSISTYSDSLDDVPAVKKTRFEREVSDDEDFAPTVAALEEATSSSTVPTDIDEEETDIKRQKHRWEQAVEDCFNHSHGTVDLSDSRLTFISAEAIHDLSKFWTIPHNHSLIPTSPPARQLERVKTAPSGVLGGLPRHFKRTHSVADGAMNLPTDDVHLFLQNNFIASLPQALFDLKRLTVLVLGRNKLTLIPPEVGLLTNLKSLTIAQNQITYLPAEIDKLSLDRLLVFPNKFLPAPASGKPSQAERVLGRVLSLFELCARKLLTLGANGETLLRNTYKTPICELYGQECMSEGAGQRHFHRNLPLTVRHILDVCDPLSVYDDGGMLPQSVDRGRDYHAVTGLGKCPSPKHKDHDSFFVMHAEERFTWESVVAGFPVGGTVPLRWRGCQWGCLDFLDQDKVQAEELANVKGENIVREISIPAASDGFTAFD